MGTGHFLAALSLASRFGAEEEGLHVLEGSGHPGAGKHIAKGWAEPHPPHITAESSRTPGCSSCHHPALSSHSTVPAVWVPLSCEVPGPRSSLACLKMGVSHDFSLL